MKTKDIVKIYPTENGYRFSPQPEKHKAALLAILERTQEVEIDSNFSVFIQAAWLEPLWQALKRPAGLVAGLKATQLASTVHRGSQSMWAIACISERAISFPASEASEALCQIQTMLPSCLTERSDFSDSLRTAIKSSGEEAMSNILEKIPCAMRKINVSATASRLTNPLSSFF